MNEDAINIAFILRLIYDASRQMLMHTENRLDASNKQIIRVTRYAIHCIFQEALLQQVHGCSRLGHLKVLYKMGIEPENNRVDYYDMR